MIGNIVKLKQDTVIVYVNGDSIPLWSIQPDVKDTILQNQKTATDLKRKIRRFMATVNVLQDGDPENEDSKSILDFAKKCFGDFEAKE